MEPVTSRASMAAAAGAYFGAAPLAETTEGGELADAGVAVYGPVQWAPLGNVAASWQQQGVWGARMLTQTPAYLSGAQRGCVAGSLYPGWEVPANRTGTRAPDLWRAMRPGHFAGAQRRSGNYGTGPASPSNQAASYRITAAAAQANSANLMAAVRAYGSR
jgi:hypothetical protein